MLQNHLSQNHLSQNSKKSALPIRQSCFFYLLLPLTGTRLSSRFQAAQAVCNTDSDENAAGINQDIADLACSSGHKELVEFIAGRIQNTCEKRQGKAYFERRR